jgi:signal transduction histidine kinase
MPAKQEIHLPGMLKEISGLYKETCYRKGIYCSIHLGPENLVIMADDAQLRQVLINLIKNAIEAMDNEKQPAIRIYVKRILHQVSIEVNNSGPAIPPDILEKIFVPFYSTKPEGSGIGLSLSRQIISNHGGQIAVESEEGKGTTFRIVLPVGY